MARLPLLNVEDLPESDRDVLERPINLYRLFAHLPELARRYRQMGRWLRFESGMDPRLRELAILQVGVLTGSPYEATHHVHLGREFGVSDEDIRAIGAETRGEPNELGEQERTVLRAARELTAGVRISDATWDALGQWFSQKERLELTVLISFYNMTIRIAGAADLDIEDDYLQYLSFFPEMKDDSANEG
ncbi:MAG TPA: carboxymuconolactone decarboxylase family protein [Trebonia sp.]